MASRIHISLLALTLVAALAGTARAIPPDRIVQLQPDQDRFEKGYPGRWRAESLDPNVVGVQAFETAEVHLEAKGVGETLVLLVNRAINQVIVWQVRVGGSPPSPAPAAREAVDRACHCRVEEGRLACTVADQKCLDALGAFLPTSGLLAEGLRLHYTLPALQQLLRQILADLKASGISGVDLAFSGANLRLTGRVPDEATWRRVIVLCYRGMLGKLILEDRLLVTKEDRGLLQESPDFNQVFRR